MASCCLKGAESMGYGKGYMLQVAVEVDMALLRHALLRGFEAAGAVTTLAEKTGVGASTDAQQ